jgi:signal transduction histidine kinase
MRERGHVIADKTRNILRITGTTQDITSEKELDRAKTEFISLTSHQLRTPPTGIKWYTGMLLDEDVGKLTQDQRKYLEQIEYNNQRMIDVVNSVLNISQIELGAFQNHPTPTNIPNLLDKICAEFEVQIKNKDITLTRDYERDDRSVLIDPTLVRIVLQNLLFNAIKYTEKGGSVTLFASTANQTLLITMTDTGRGIPEEDAPNIFKKFFRASNVQDHSSGGTGLGLYLVKRILGQINGTIDFTSTLGEGTTFSIVIPLQTNEPEVA